MSNLYECEECEFQFEEDGEICPNCSSTNIMTIELDEEDASEEGSDAILDSL